MARSSTPAVDRRDASKAERVYASLRRRIRDLDLPPGAALRKDDIAAHLGVSRAPVSEAIARLAEEGLAEVFPQHGSFVAPIRAADVREALFIRMALETEAVRRLAGVAPPELLDRLDESLDHQGRALARGDLPTFYDLDEALHGELFVAVAGPRTRRLLNAARAPLDRVRRLIPPEAGRAQATLAEHRQVIDALRSGDGGFAAGAMRVHLSMVGRAVEGELAKLAKAAIWPA